MPTGWATFSDQSWSLVLLFLQLQLDSFPSSVHALSNFELCLLIFSFMFVKVQYVALTVFLLKHLFRICPFGKCLSIKPRSSFITLVVTDLLKGGLKYMLLRDLFLFFFITGFCYFRLTLYPWSLRAFSYSCLCALIISMLLDNVDNLFSIIIGICLVMCFGWLELILIYSVLLPGLQ